MSTYTPDDDDYQLCMPLMPIMPHKPLDDDDAYLAEVDDYFSRPYVPLSNLPTPPLSSCASDLAANPEDEDDLDPALLGPAIHITNTIPRAVSPAAPSVALIHGLLTRAMLPPTTLALVVCMLDSLDARTFTASWRRRSGAGVAAPSHPELLVLAVLLLSMKFVDDRDVPAAAFARIVGRGRWTPAMLNAAEACVLETLDYRIAPLWRVDLIRDALLDMQRAGRDLPPDDCTPPDSADEDAASPTTDEDDAASVTSAAEPSSPGSCWDERSTMADESRARAAKMRLQLPRVADETDEMRC